MKNNKLLRLIGILGGVALLIAAFFMYAGAFTHMNSGFKDTYIDISGYEYCFPKNGDPVSGILTGWILSLILLIAALAVCVLFVLDLAGIFHLKLADNKFVRYGVGCCALVLGIAIGILNFCTSSLISDTFNFTIGAGAIFAGIFHILGGILLACGVVLPALKK